MCKRKPENLLNLEKDEPLKVSDSGSKSEFALGFTKQTATKVVHSKTPAGNAKLPFVNLTEIG